MLAQHQCLLRKSIPGKRFVLLCQHFYPEMVSTGMHMTELATRLSELGWQITVYCAKPSWDTDNSKDESIPRESLYRGIKIRRVPTVGDQQSSLLARGIFALSFFFSVAWALWRKRGDYPGIVVTTNPPFLGLLGCLFTRLLGIPYLLIVYDIYPDIAINLGVMSPRSLLAKVWSWVTNQIFRNSEVLVVIGRDMAGIVKRKTPTYVHERIVLIPNWSDERLVKPIPRNENAFRQEHNLDNVFVVQYAGRMGRTHNLEPLIEAALIMVNEQVLFQFIGEGAKKASLEAMVADYGLNNVQFLPYQPMERLAEMLSAADMALVCLDNVFTGLSVPSKTYGVIASGTPILGFVDPLSEIGKMIVESGCGLVLNEPTGLEVAATIRELMNNPNRVNAMATAGRTTFLENYTLSHAARAYDSALGTLLETAVKTPSLHVTT